MAYLQSRKLPVALISVLVFGYAFLYIPIASLVVYSFNDSKLVTVWGGFSTKWYGELLNNQALISAFWLSLKIAFVAATVAVILGTCAAVVLVKFRRFRGKTLFSALIAAPLVMPEVIIGLAMLLLFVSFQQFIGWPKSRGVTTITLAHITLTMAYVAFIVRVRLEGFDKSLTEAAQDLGAPPFKVFCVVTLPIISPSLIAGWLLAFTLSLDDLVIASFVSGPGSTTLPMAIYSSIRVGATPQINALATLFIGTVALGITIVGYTLYRRQTQKT